MKSRIDSNFTISKEQGAISIFYSDDTINGFLVVEFLEEKPLSTHLNTSDTKVQSVVTKSYKLKIANEKYECCITDYMDEIETHKIIDMNPDCNIDLLETFEINSSELLKIRERVERDKIFLSQINYLTDDDKTLSELFVSSYSKDHIFPIGYNSYIWATELLHQAKIVFKPNVPPPFSKGIFSGFGGLFTALKAQPNIADYIKEKSYIKIRRAVILENIKINTADGFLITAIEKKDLKALFLLLKLGAPLKPTVLNTILEQMKFEQRIIIFRTLYDTKRIKLAEYRCFIHLDWIEELEEKGKIQLYGSRKSYKLLTFADITIAKAIHAGLSEIGIKNKQIFDTPPDIEDAGWIYGIELSIDEFNKAYNNKAYNNKELQSRELITEKSTNIPNDNPKPSI